MTFTVKSPFEHDDKSYDPGDDFAGLTEKEATAAGLVPRVLVPQNSAQANSGSSSKKGGSKGPSKKGSGSDEDA